MRTQDRRRLWVYFVAIAVLAAALASRVQAVTAQEATPVVVAEAATGLFTGTIQIGEDFDAGGEPFGGQCLLVFDTIMAEGDPIGTVCDDGPDDQDARAGVVVCPLPVGIEYGFALDPAYVPEAYEAGIDGISGGPLTQRGGEVYFVLVPDGVELVYFVGLADGRQLVPGYPSGVGIDGACFELREAGGDVVDGEHCSEFQGGLWWGIVWIGSYTLVPTSLPDGCIVAEIVGDQPFVVTREMVDTPPSGDNANPGFWGGWVILDCDPATLATITLHAATCPPDEPDLFAACHGNALEGLALAPDEFTTLPLLVSGPDGTDHVQVQPGEVYLAQIDPNYDFEHGATIDYNAYVYCAEQHTGAVLFDGRLTWPPEGEEWYDDFQGPPVRFEVAAGDDVVCDWYALGGAPGNGPAPTPTPVPGVTPTPSSGASGVTTLPNTGAAPEDAARGGLGGASLLALLLAARLVRRGVRRRLAAVRST